MHKFINLLQFSRLLNNTLNQCFSLMTASNQNK